MKIISLEIKKITLGRFFPKENKLEFNIFFNDGSDKEILRVLGTSDPDAAAEEIVADLRRMEKNIHKVDEEKEFLPGEMVNIVMKDEDKALKAISQFIQQANFKVDRVKHKNDAVGYLDLIRDLKSLRLELE